MGWGYPIQSLKKFSRLLFLIPHLSYIGSLFICLDIFPALTVSQGHSVISKPLKFQPELAYLEMGFCEGWNSGPKSIP